MEPDDELGVLADRVSRIASDRLDELSFEDAERPRDDEDAVDAVEGEPADEERPEVLENLEACDVAGGQAEVDEPPALDHGSVRNSDDAARRRDELGVVDERSDDPKQ